MNITGAYLERAIPIPTLKRKAAVDKQRVVRVVSILTREWKKKQTPNSLGPRVDNVVVAPRSSWIALNCADTIDCHCSHRLTMSTQTVGEESSPPPNLGEISTEPPLFDDPDADIILRSCDNREFRVLKYNVIKASPVLREAIQSAPSLSTAGTTPWPWLPSVQLSDSSDTLSSLLSFILPMPSVLPSTIEQTMLFLSAAQKYQMEFTMISIRGAIALQDPPFVRQETALQVYSLAQTHGLRQEALHAARVTVTSPFTFEDLEDNLDSTPLVDLHGLWKYHQRVRTYLAADLTAFKTTGVPGEMASQPCSYGMINWLGQYLGSIARSPGLFNLTEFHMFLTRHTRACACTCINIPGSAIRAFWMALTDVVHDCMTRVSIDVYEIYEIGNGPHRLNQIS